MWGNLNLPCYILRLFPLVLLLLPVRKDQHPPHYMSKMAQSSTASRSAPSLQAEYKFSCGKIYTLDKTHFCILCSLWVFPHFCQGWVTHSIFSITWIFIMCISLSYFIGQIVVYSILLLSLLSEQYFLPVPWPHNINSCRQEGTFFFRKGKGNSCKQFVVSNH